MNIANLDISPNLQKGLECLSMLDDNKAKEGLRFIDNIELEKDAYIKIHLYEARKHHAKAVYFRHFDKRPSIPQIYLYEEDAAIDTNSLHKELWSSCKVPIFVLFSTTKIKIFNSLSKKDISQKDITPLEIIEITSQFQTISDVQKNFLATMFDSGEFWNTDIAKNNFRYEHSAYNSLINNLTVSRQFLINDNKLSENIINTLLMKFILVKYLEERKVIPIDYWQRFIKGGVCFVDVCAKKESLINMFNDLHKRFNGGIFQFSKEEHEQISEHGLKLFTRFLEGDVDLSTAQKHFWSLYSFEHLPIELISNIYELFLKKEEKDKEGIVYTPPMLVNFLIDEIMPLDKPKENFKVVDPSCGSGVFLVAAYKRLIQWNWLSDEDFRKKPNIDRLRNVLKDNIYGVDKEGEAVKLAQFSLALTMCDALTPNIIWGKLRFEDLIKMGNLITDDFFNVLDVKVMLENFDLVIGNPPFVSGLTEQAERVNGAKVKDGRPELPDKKLAFLFLEQSFELCKGGGDVCMIQQPAFLYNNNAENFRKYLLGKYSAQQIADFAGLNSSLFKRSGGGANVGVSAVFFKKEKPDIENSKLLHLTVRETFETKEKLYFDLSYYDFHWISYKEAINNKYIWKCNLVGGSRTINIINRLKAFPTFSDFIKDKEENNNWIYSTGFIVGNKKNITDLCGYTALQTKPENALSEKGIDFSRTYIITNTKMEAQRNLKLYDPPLVIIRNTLNKESVLIGYSDKQMAFNHSFVGISAPEQYAQDLQMIVSNFKMRSKEFIFFLIATSGKIGIDKATVLLKQDIDSLPYPANINDVKLSNIEKYFAGDVIDYMLDWINGKNDLPIFKSINDEQLKEYINIYCTLLNTVYSKFKLCDLLKTDHFIVIAFCYGKEPTNPIFWKQEKTEDLNVNINDIIINKYKQNVNIKRIIKIYDRNVIYIIKPKQYRFWLKSIAVRDADETFADLVHMRYS
ncbi:MAG: SAM-dependent methyltransferase [Helicobacteraceae bacterium]|jgi:hypothetical protein|nr:SAM-dependent methyltransferase [Helicobacteraceae bacterium]